MTQLAEIQNAFARALLDAAEPVPVAIRGAARRRADRRFAVYRNNVVAGLVDALAQRFPVVARLVGDEFFRAMARVHVTTRPPDSPLMMLYGESFPDFIDGFAPAASVPYLGDIARVEIARGRAYHAADAVPVGPKIFAALPLERLGDLRLQLHPSVSIIASAYPIVSIWQVNSDPDRAVPVAPWAAEAALVARPFMDVEVRRLPPGAAAFLSCLACGGAMAEAIEAGTIAAAAEFDIVESLALLIVSGVVTGIDGHVGVVPSKRKAASRRPRQPTAPRRLEHGNALFA
jgi:hypothetical protein